MRRDRENDGIRCGGGVAAGPAVSRRFGVFLGRLHRGLWSEASGTALGRPVEVEVNCLDVVVGGVVAVLRDVATFSRWSALSKVSSTGCGRVWEVSRNGMDTVRGSGNERRELD